MVLGMRTNEEVRKFDFERRKNYVHTQRTEFLLIIESIIYRLEEGNCLMYSYNLCPKNVCFFC